MRDAFRQNIQQSEEKTLATTQKIGLGGGCHWCTEAVYQSLVGVTHVQQGWIASTGKNGAFSEAVIVHFDPEIISLGVLVEIHLHTHKSTSKHAMRGKYRSALYYFTSSQTPLLEDILQRLQRDFSDPLITEILEYAAFKSTETKYKNYYYGNPSKPFCGSYIHPKLEMLRQQYHRYMDPKILEDT